MVSEKTLELNVVAELLEYFRIFYSPKIFFRGLTLREEGVMGYDNSISLGSAEFTFFQFKAPKRRNPTTFYINNNKKNDQHNILYNLAYQAGPGVVFYAFPVFFSDFDMFAFSPQLLRNTYFMDISPIGLLSPKQHKVEVNIQNKTARVYYSKPKEFKLISGEDITKVLYERDYYKKQEADPVFGLKFVNGERLNRLLKECFYSPENVPISSKWIRCKSFVKINQEQQTLKQIVG